MSRRTSSMAISQRTGSSLTTRIVPPPPHCMDVFLGRGKSFRKNPGNILFQELVQANLLRYSQSSNTEKKVITTEIICIIRNARGRFIRLIDKNQWTVISEMEAHQKVMHAIQYRLRHDGSKDTESDKSSSVLTTTANEALNTFEIQSSRFLTYPPTVNQLHLYSQERQLQQATTTTADDICFVNNCDTATAVAAASDYLIDRHMLPQLPVQHHQVNPSTQQQERAMCDYVSSHQPSEYAYHNDEWRNQYHFNAAGGDINPFVVNTNNCGDWSQFPTMFPVERVCDPSPLVPLLPQQFSISSCSKNVVDEIGVDRSNTRSRTVASELSNKQLLLYHGGNDEPIPISPNESLISLHDILLLNADILAFCSEPTKTNTEDNNNNNDTYQSERRSCDGGDEVAEKSTIVSPPPPTVPFHINNDNHDDDGDMQPVASVATSLQRTTSDLSSWDDSSFPLLS